MERAHQNVISKPSKAQAPNVLELLKSKEVSYATCDSDLNPIRNQRTCSQRFSQEKFEKKLIDFIILSSQPFTVVENQEIGRASCRERV